MQITRFGIIQALALMMFTFAGRGMCSRIGTGTWVFQNTSGATATDFEVLALDNSLTFVKGSSSGGAQFPNTSFTSAVMSGSPSAIYSTSGPNQGVPAGGFYSMTFNAPPGTQFDVSFTFASLPAQDPGRVFKQVNEQFQFVPELSPAGPLIGDLPDFPQIVSAGGTTTAVPESGTFIMIGTGLVLFYLRMRPRVLA